MARRVAARLQHEPVGRAVALLASSSAELVATWFGASLAGLVVMPLHGGSPPAEVAARRAQVGGALLITDAAHRSGMEGELNIAELCAPGELADFCRQPTSGVAMMLFTSATTGQPKAVEITHRSLRTHSIAVATQTLQLGPSDVVLGALPLAHSFGFRMTLLAPFSVGASCALVQGRFDAERTLQMAAQERVTWLAGVPTMFARWANASAAAWPELRWCLSAGAPLPEPIRQRAQARLGVPVHQGYGLTEASFSAIDSPSSSSVAGTCGRATPGVELRIAPVGESSEVGEILVRGTNLMRGYFGDPDATGAAMQDGWLRTGDLGRLDEGTLTVIDRLKDIILRGGHNVSPSEVEAALLLHPDVSRAAVVGRHDAILGEEVVALIVPESLGNRPPFSALNTHLRALLPSSKVPREYAFIDALPLTSTRKVARRLLRERLARGDIRAERVSQVSQG